MNKRTITLLAGVAVVAAVVALVVTLIVATRPGDNANAQTAGVTGPQNGVTVTGDGYVLVTPDIVNFDAGLNLRAPTVAEAQKQAADKMDAIKKALTGLGIKDEDIKTASYNINPNYIYDQGKSPTLDGYMVTTAWGVTVRDVSKAGAAIDAAGAAGANQIGNILFGRDKQVDLIKQARVAAMADAKTKADQLAGAGGFTIGGVMSVTEVSSNNSGPQPYKLAAPAAGMADSAASTVIQGGQFKVMVTVQVVYAIK